MIRVTPIPPTASYEEEVRKPGEQFLLNNPHATSGDLNRHDYWSEIHQEMYDGYSGICMYCASWTPRQATGASFRQSSIDHFMPKGDPRFRHLAYEWQNFRLCRNDINTNKRREILVPDPFGIRNEWFKVDFATWRVEPTDQTPVQLFQRSRMVFTMLGLNTDFYISERQEAAAIYVHCANERIELRTLYPFLTAELERQGQGTDLFHELRLLLPLP